jgi:adenine/guanine phosphoribosyltransferase-like PRPP-binding protein
MSQEGRSGVPGRPLVGMNIERGRQAGAIALAQRAPRLTDVAIATVADSPRGDLVSPYDARYVTLRPSELAPLIDRLVSAIDATTIDTVLAISESGVVPAFAFAAATDLPLVIATEAEAELPQAIAFDSGHDQARGRRRSRRIYPLSAGDSVIVVEHLTVTGDSILRCVSALRAEGIACRQAASLLAVDEEILFARLAAAQIELHVAALVPSETTRLLYRHGETAP